MPQSTPGLVFADCAELLQFWLNLSLSLNIPNQQSSESHLAGGLESRRFRDGSVGKGFTCSAGNTGVVGLIPGLARSPGEGTDNPLQYSFLKNPTDRGAWQAAVQRVAKSQTQLSAFGKQK